MTIRIVKRHLFEIILISLNHDEEGIKYASHTFLRTFTCHIETAKKPWLSNFLTDFNEPLPRLLFSSITFFVCWQILFLFRLSFSKMSHNWDLFCKHLFKISFDEDVAWIFFKRSSPLDSKNEITPSQTLCGCVFTSTSLFCSPEFPQKWLRRLRSFQPKSQVKRSLTSTRASLQLPGGGWLFLLWQCMLLCETEVVWVL